MAILDRLDEMERLKRMGLLNTAEPDFSAVAGGGGSRRTPQYGFGPNAIFGPSVNIPKGTVVPTVEGKPNMIDRNVDLSDAQKALALNTLQNFKNTDVKPAVVGPFTDFKGFGGIKGIVSDMVAGSDANLGPTSAQQQQSRIDTQFYDERRYIVDPQDGRVLYDSDKISEIENVMKNLDTLGIDNAFVLTRKELDNFKRNVTSQPTVDSFGSPILTADIIQSARIGTQDSNKAKEQVNPISQENLALIKNALVEYENDDRTFEEIKKEYTASIKDKVFNYDIYKENGEKYSEEELKDIFNTESQIPFPDFKEGFDVTAASGGDITGIVDRSASTIFEFFNQPAPKFAQDTSINRATFDTMIQPILWFRARSLMPKPTAGEINKQREFLPSFDKTDFKNASLTRTAITDMQNRLKIALNKREGLRQNPAGGKLNDFDARLIAEGPALIEMMKAMLKQFESKGIGYGSGVKRNNPYEQSPVIETQFGGG